VATGEIPGKWPQLFRGTVMGELYLVSWWNEQGGAVYKIFHSTDNGDSFMPQYASEPMNLYYGGAIFSAGNNPGSFYVCKPRIDLSTNHIHLYIDYSSDYGQTFTTYFHDLHYFFVGVNDDEVESSKQFLIYPNPGHDLVRIINHKQANQTCDQIQIYNIVGKEILRIPEVDLQNGYVIDVSDFEAGIYIVTISDNREKTWSEKLIVEK
jgi:hypothetical protein